MNKMIALSLIAIAQVALAGTLWWHHQQQKPTAQPLLTLDRHAIDSLVLEHQGERLQLVKKQGEWQLPDLHHEPASPSKVSALLSELAQAELVWPIADSTTSHARLDVAADQFQWKVTLKNAEQYQTIYFGQSPAFKQLYVRRDGENAIFQQSINTADWSTEPSDWFDSQQLQLTQISHIRMNQYELIKQQENWQLLHSDATQTVNHPVDAQQISKLQQWFSTLRVQAPNTAKTVLASPEPVKEIAVRALGGQYVYQIAQQSDQSYLIQRQDNPMWYPIAEQIAKQLIDLDFNQMIASEHNQTSDSKEPAAIAPLTPDSTKTNSTTLNASPPSE